MKTETLLERLDGVRRSGRGWMARCPAHADRNPSLSIGEGEKAILLYCFAGCTVKEITAALGLCPSNLFYESGIPRAQPKAKPTKPPPFDWRRYASEIVDEALGLWLRGSKVLEAARGLEISTWTDEDLDEGMEAVACAHTDLARADALETLACNIRAGGLREKKEDASRRSAA